MKKIVWVIIVVLDGLLLVSSYPFSCNSGNVCESTTAGILISLVLLLPGMVVNTGVLIHSAIKNNSKYTILLGISLFILLLPWLIPPLGMVMKKGFDINAADMGINPNFQELILASYLDLLRILIPVNVILAYWLSLWKEGTKSKASQKI